MDGIEIIITKHGWRKFVGQVFKDEQLKYFVRGSFKFTSSQCAAFCVRKGWGD